MKGLGEWVKMENEYRSPKGDRRRMKERENERGREAVEECSEVREFLRVKGTKGGTVFIEETSRKYLRKERI